MLTATGSTPVMDTQMNQSFMLGEIKVSPSHNTLWVQNNRVKLQPKAMAVLQYLANNQRRVISNEELIEHVWAGRIVTHGSVQKSINALRSGLSELVSGQEFIAHYSKRGYQLTVEPRFLTEEPIDEKSGDKLPLEKRSHFSKRQLIGLSIIIVIGLVALFKDFNWYKIYLPIQHKTSFQNALGYTSETGHEHSATPNPDNLHVAYIRQGVDSNIIVRNFQGKDWLVAQTNGTWSKLAWSPAGNNLVAIEIKRRDGSPLGSRFYEPINHLYSFHIFKLDLAQQRILEKQQLSQWQGRIFSVTWWDEDTLEIVAKQGPNSGNARYRYSILDQELNLLDEFEGSRNPLSSSTFEKKTAIASGYTNKTRIDFLDVDQQPISHLFIDAGAVDISWIPDGSGVLAYAEEERKLIAAYLNGEQSIIPITEAKDKTIKHARYSADGSTIYYTEEKRKANILVKKIDGEKSPLTENTDLNYAASFSPDGKKIVYASVRNNQIHLWLIQNGQERQLSPQALPAKIGAIVWSEDSNHLTFNSGNELYRYDFLDSKINLITTEHDNIEPVGYSPKENSIFLIKYKKGLGNLWKIEGNQHKQLTFGAVGSAITEGDDVLFQYVGENGLWLLRSNDDSLEQVIAELDEYSKLLKADKTGFYFVTGATCNESDIFYQVYTSSDKTIFLKQDNPAVSTTSFHEAEGLLQTECHLPEANIMYMQ